MSKCKLFTICGLKAIGPDGLCILHSRNSEKDKEAFLKTCQNQLDRENYNFESFYFPDGTGKFLRKSFEKEVRFNWSTFEGWASFDESIFEKSVSFHGVIFLGEVSFNGSTFQGESTFRGAVFQRRMSLEETVFEGKTNFNWTKFYGETTFRKAIFHNAASFSGAAFQKTVSFNHATFKREALFTQGEVSLFAEEALFTSVHLEKPELIRFEKVNLSRTSLLRTPVRKVDFVDVDWATIPSGIASNFRLGKKELPNHEPATMVGRLGLFDEIAAQKENLVLIEDLYRQLKINYEKRGDHERAGSFHYGEKEMKRWRRPFWRDPFLWFYWIFSGYSESFGRAALWLILFIVAGGFSYGLIGFNESKPLGYTFLHSFKITLLPRLHAAKDFNHFFGSWIEILQFFLGKFQIGLLFLALRQRLRR
jgi:uncharacterized protein YjbI with pentapeptide repeats